MLCTYFLHKYTILDAGRMSVTVIFRRMSGYVLKNHTNITLRLQSKLDTNLTYSRYSWTVVHIAEHMCKIDNHYNTVVCLLKLHSIVWLKQFLSTGMSKSAWGEVNTINYNLHPALAIQLAILWTWNYSFKEILKYPFKQYSCVIICNITFWIDKCTVHYTNDQVVKISCSMTW